MNNRDRKKYITVQEYNDIISENAKLKEEVESLKVTSTPILNIEIKHLALRKLVDKYKKIGKSIRQEHGFLDDCVCNRCEALRALEEEG